MSESLIDRLVDFFKTVKGGFAVLMLVRFSLLLGIVCSGIFLCVAQGQEILLHLSTDTWIKQLLFGLTGVFCALSVWYSARIMYRFEFDELIAMTGLSRWIKRHVPRILGGSVLVSLSLAISVATAGRLWTLSLSFLGAAVVFLVFVYRRRRIFSWFGLVHYDEEPNRLKRFADLGGIQRAYFLASAILYVLALAIFSTDYGHSLMAPWLGAGTVVLLSFALLVPLGTAVIYLGQHSHLPALILLVIAVMLFSFLNDNHQVRQVSDLVATEGESEPTPPLATDLMSYYEKWVSGLIPPEETGEIPVYIVATEGGGVRAAFWTAIVLGRLQDTSQLQSADFARHVFAISGVSGGSLGGTTFAALLRDPDRGKLEDRARAILGQDFLSPTLAAMFFPDLVQRFLPFPFFEDRAVALERAWEVAWKNAEENDLFTGPFRDLWKGTAAGIPLLFLNSTAVRSGRRVIVSPIDFRLDQKVDRFSDVFHDAIDATKAIGLDLPVSTAVHMSARFTYVSPAGTIHRRDAGRRPGERPWIRVVDGGYFENSGAVTAGEILSSIRSHESEQGKGRRVKPYVIHISNDPEETKVYSPDDGRRTFMGEALSPLFALLAVRPARGFQARDELRREALSFDAGGFEQSNQGYFHFRLKKSDVNLPLGWLLSPQAQDEMSKQLDSQKAKIDAVLKPLEAR